MIRAEEADPDRGKMVDDVNEGRRMRIFLETHIVLFGNLDGASNKLIVLLFKMLRTVANWRGSLVLHIFGKSEVLECKEYYFRFHLNTLRSKFLKISKPQIQNS